MSSPPPWRPAATPAPTRIGSASHGRTPPTGNSGPDPDLDLVYNALPPALHARWSISALEAGKHVLCEKPFTMNAAEAERVVAAAERTARRAIEAFHDHYHPLSGWIRTFLAEGSLGAVSRVEAVFTVYAAAGVSRR